MLYGFKTQGTSQPDMGFNSHSATLNQFEYKLLNRKNTDFTPCGLSLIQMETNYKYHALSNESQSFKFSGDNIGFAFVPLASYNEAVLTNEMIDKIKELCFTHNVELVRWSKKEYGFYGGNWEHYESSNGDLVVINRCIFMKPSIGIKAVWKEFNTFLEQYATRLQYVLEDSLKTLEKESSEKTKKENELSSLINELTLA